MLAQASRPGRLTSEGLATAIDAIGDLYHPLDLLEIDDTSILVAGDRDPCTAAGQLGMAVTSTTSTDG